MGYSYNSYKRCSDKTKIGIKSSFEFRARVLVVGKVGKKWDILCT